MFFIYKALTNSIPDSFSPKDLEDLMSKAPKDDDNRSSKDVTKAAPYNGYDRTELVSSIRSSIHALDEKFDYHPMIMKIAALECLRDLVKMHTDFGMSQFDDDERSSAVAWLRDAGKLQAALTNLLDVELGDDFTVKS